MNAPFTADVQTDLKRPIKLMAQAAKLLYIRGKKFLENNSHNYTSELPVYKINQNSFQGSGHKTTLSEIIVQFYDSLNKE